VLASLSPRWLISVWTRDKRLCSSPRSLIVGRTRLTTTTTADQQRHVQGGSAACSATATPDDSSAAPSSASSSTCCGLEQRGDGPSHVRQVKFIEERIMESDSGVASRLDDVDQSQLQPPAPSARHVTIATDEDHAFRTKIDR